MKRPLVIAAAAGLGLLASMVAYADDATPAPQPVAAADNPNHLYCHPMIHEGMILHRKECYTQQEWDRIRHESEADLINLQLRSLAFSQP